MKRRGRERVHFACKIFCIAQSIEAIGGNRAMALRQSRCANSSTVHTIAALQHPLLATIAMIKTTCVLSRPPTTCGGKALHSTARAVY